MDTVATSANEALQARTIGRLGSAILIAAVGISALLLDQASASSNAVILALGLGMLLSNASPLRHRRLETAVTSYVLNNLLKAGVILLGAGANLYLLSGIGAAVVLAIVVNIVVAFTIASAATSHLRLPKGITILLAAGTAICGASAIVAAAPIVRSKRDEVGAAIGITLALNTLGLLVYPAIGRALNLDPVTYGSWVGLAVHDTASAIAAGLSHGAAAGDVATVVKLSRTLFLIPLLMVLSAATRQPSQQALRGRKVGLTGAVMSGAPWFVLGFLALAALNTADLLSSMGQPMHTAGKGFIVIVVATFAMNLRFHDLRSLGTRLVITGLTAMAAIGLISLGIVSWVGVNG